MDPREQIIAAVGVFLLLFVIYCIYHNRKRKKKILAKVRKNWGQRPEREYLTEEFEALTHYFKRNRDRKESVIDDITWNDLEMDTIFMLINQTHSSIGEAYLYSMLRTPEFSEEKLKERDRLVEFFATHERERERLAVLLEDIGRTGRYSIFDHVYDLADFRKGSKWIHYLGFLFLAVAIGVTVVWPEYGILAIIGAISYSWTTYYFQRKKIEPYVISCVSVLRMLKMADRFTQVRIPEIKEYQKQISEAKRRFSKFKRNTLFVTVGGFGKNGGGIEETIIMYSNFTFHIDLLQFSVLVREMNKNLAAFDLMVESIGELESALAIASFRTLMSEHCKPHLDISKESYLKVEEVYHPMIKEPVKNSITAPRGALITGSNASGKSTFLKTVAINAILAQTIYTCMADSYSGSYHQIYSSMALTDNLEKMESYYIVEIKSLKRILDSISGKYPILCFVDEVLRGTNTVERIAASSQILKSMARTDVMCFAATHDIELTHMLAEDYDNFHFQEEVVENDILFNYQLYEGRATSRNAIKLLGIIGYQEEIIQNAEITATRFMETGEWELC